LAADDHPDAGDDYSAAWNRWLSEEQRTASPHFGHGHHDTLLIPARGRVGSPVGGALTLLSAELRKRAISVDDQALIMDEDGESELIEPWVGARAALLHAIMALGAPSLCENNHLLQAWVRWRLEKNQVR
jgi:hypothetical protein